MSYRKTFIHQPIYQPKIIRKKKYTYFIRDGNSWNNPTHSCAKTKKFFLGINDSKQYLIERIKKKQKDDGQRIQSERISRVNKQRKTCLKLSQRFRQLQNNAQLTKQINLNQSNKRKYLHSVQNSWNQINRLDKKHLKNLVSNKTLKDQQRFVQEYLKRLHQQKIAKRKRKTQLKQFRHNLLIKMGFSQKMIQNQQDDEQIEQNYRLMQRADLTNLVLTQLRM